jgi:hypothetical protein
MEVFQLAARLIFVLRNENESVVECNEDVHKWYDERGIIMSIFKDDARKYN